MTISDRWYYLVAGIFSLAIHILILMITVPHLFMTNPVTLDTFPVGIVELSGGESGSVPDGKIGAGPPGTKGLAGSSPEKTDPKPVPVPGTGNAQPIKDGVAVGPRNTGSPPVTGTGEGSKGPGGPGSGTPVGLGSGEKMVAVLGPLPPYPKNALNEGKEGDVTLRIVVKADGGLERVDLLRSAGDQRLDKVAVRAIERTWKFKPVQDPYFIELAFVFRVGTGVGVKFLKSETRPGGG